MSGSSPRLWGKLTGIASTDIKTRFIPTPVGKTMKVILRLALTTVHPHACGENFSLQDICDAVDRFIPTPVGKTPAFDVSSGEEVWFIPTPVGKTLSAPDASRARAVHPHACGENAPSKLGKVIGNSVHPHACGENDSAIHCKLCWARFIPTPVGKTPLCRRVCLSVFRFIPTPVGKTHSSGISRPISRGSSPRLWGKR